MRRLLIVALLLLGSLGLASAAVANHTPGACTGCASHVYWPEIDGVIRKAEGASAHFTGTRRDDELLGHHGSDVLRGGPGSDVLWGDWDPDGQPATQHDVILGGAGSDFIYASHGRNVIHAGAGNDAISIHYGHGILDCGPGRDVYHVARSRRAGWTIRNCEKVDYRPEHVRGAGLKPLP